MSACFLGPHYPTRCNIGFAFADLAPDKLTSLILKTIKLLGRDHYSGWFTILSDDHRLPRGSYPLKPACGLSLKFSERYDVFGYLYGFHGIPLMEEYSTF